MAKVKENLNTKYGKGSLDRDAILEHIAYLEPSFAGINYAGQQILGVGTVSAAVSRVQRGEEVILIGGETTRSISVSKPGWYRVTLSLWVNATGTIPNKSRTLFTIRNGSKELFSNIKYFNPSDEYVSIYSSVVVFIDPSLGNVNVQSNSSGFAPMPIVGSGSLLNNSFLLVEKV